ncbi:MAG: DUF342 domain-containing protein, partial [Cyanobacteria bacterium REEB65]|nr:DUF342 domain-containing protein [Cyanobacteria bacterium REEB65]
MAITVIVAKNHLSASILLTEDDKPTVVDLRQALQGCGVVYGIRNDLLEEIASDPKAGEYEVAIGDPPIHGEDAEIEYFFRTTKPVLTPQILEDGRADYFNLGIAESVKPGQLLARKKPAVQGKAGQSIEGDELRPRVVRDVNFRVGAGVTVSDDGLEVHASARGEPHLNRGIISVSDTFEVRGDVDTSTGNIDFDGNVEILGGVLKNFRVKANGSIHVQGAVEGGILEAKGSIVVNGGVFHAARLKAEGDVQVRFMEHSDVRATGNLVVQDDMIFSEADVDGCVLIDGELIGGSCKSDICVKANSIGSKMGTETWVVLAPREKWLAIRKDLEAKVKE